MDPVVAKHRQSAGVLSPNREGCAGLPGPGGSMAMSGDSVGARPVRRRPKKQCLDPGCQTRPPGGHGGPVWSPDAALMDTVASLQRDMEELRAGSRSRHRHRTFGFRKVSMTGGIYVN